MASEYARVSDDEIRRIAAHNAIKWAGLLEILANSDG